MDLRAFGNWRKKKKSLYSEKPRDIIPQSVIIKKHSELQTRIKVVLNENKKIIQENANLKSELEKAKQGLTDIVTLYKKEKKEREKKEKQNEELKKMNAQLFKQVTNESPRRSPLLTKESPLRKDVKESPFIDVTNRNLSENKNFM